MLIIEKQIKNDRASYVSNRGRRKTVLKTFRPAILPITGRTSGNFDVYVLASITRFIDRSLKNFSRDYTPPLEREREGENSKGGKFQVCCRLIGVYHLFFFLLLFFLGERLFKNHHFLRWLGTRLLHRRHGCMCTQVAERMDLQV